MPLVTIMHFLSYLYYIFTQQRFYDALHESLFCINHTLISSFTPLQGKVAGEIHTIMLNSTIYIHNHDYVDTSFWFHSLFHSSRRLFHSSSAVLKPPKPPPISDKGSQKRTSKFLYTSLCVSDPLWCSHLFLWMYCPGCHTMPTLPELH